MTQSFSFRIFWFYVGGANLTYGLLGWACAWKPLSYPNLAAVGIVELVLAAGLTLAGQVDWHWPIARKRSQPPPSAAEAADA